MFYLFLFIIVSVIIPILYIKTQYIYIYFIYLTNTRASMIARDLIIYSKIRSPSNYQNESRNVMFRVGSCGVVNVTTVVVTLIIATKNECPIIILFLFFYLWPFSRPQQNIIVFVSRLGTIKRVVITRRYIYRKKL